MLSYVTQILDKKSLMNLESVH